MRELETYETAMQQMAPKLFKQMMENGSLPDHLVDVEDQFLEAIEQAQIAAQRKMPPEMDYQIRVQKYGNTRLEALEVVLSQAIEAIPKENSPE